MWREHSYLRIETHSTRSLVTLDRSRAAMSGHAALKRTPQEYVRHIALSRGLARVAGACGMMPANATATTPN